MVGDLCQYARKPDRCFIEWKYALMLDEAVAAVDPIPFQQCVEWVEVTIESVRVSPGR